MGLLDLIYPKRCLGCDNYGKYICEVCGSAAQVRGGALAYEGIVRKALKEIKYRGSFDMVEELVALWRANVRTTMVRGVVTSVPMWRGKERVRGFNQAELIAREMARGWRLPYNRLLERTRNTVPMYGLDRKSREENVRGAFGLLNQYIVKPMPSTAILVDDVWTTGATMRECERVLRERGVGEVRLVTLTR